MAVEVYFFFSSRRRHTRFKCDWSSDVCSSDLKQKTAYEDSSVTGVQTCAFLISSRRRHTRFKCDWKTCALPICGTIRRGERCRKIEMQTSVDFRFPCHCGGSF